MDKNQEILFLAIHGKCYGCGGKIKELKLEHQLSKARVLCPECKACGDGQTFRSAYKDFCKTFR